MTHLLHVHLALILWFSVSLLYCRHLRSRPQTKNTKGAGSTNHVHLEPQIHHRADAGSLRRSAAVTATDEGRGVRGGGIGHTADAIIGVSGLSLRSLRPSPCVENRSASIYLCHPVDAASSHWKLRRGGSRIWASQIPASERKTRDVLGDVTGRRVCGLRLPLPTGYAQLLSHALSTSNHPCPPVS